MSALELLAQVSARGVRVVVDGPDLVLRGPVSALPAGMVDRLRAQKLELLEQLRRPVPRPTKHELLTLAGDAEQAIHRHCETCTTCPEPAAFGTIDVPVDCCQAGRALWGSYRDARAAKVVLSEAGRWARAAGEVVRPDGLTVPATCPDCGGVREPMLYTVQGRPAVRCAACGGWAFVGGAK